MSSSEHSTFSDTPFTSPCASPPQKYRHNATIIASLSYKTLDIDFRIPAELHIRTAQLIDQYLRSLHSAEINEANEPKTLLGLVVRFLRFIIDGKQHILDTEILTTVLVAFEQNFLLNDDIHCLAISPDYREEGGVDIIGIYYRACALTNRDHDGRTPALLRAADAGDACLYTIFGGQGNTERVFEDLRGVHRTYSPLIAEFLISASELLAGLSRDQRCRGVFERDFDVLKWLRKPEATPSDEELIATKYSFPLIGLLQLLNYMVACKAVGETPCTFRRYLSGTTGHSQGIVAAVVTAAADSWESFDSIARSALTTLFWIGVRSQQVYPQAALPPATIKDSVENGEGVPTPMLSVRDMPQAQLEKNIDQVNRFFADDVKISIALINNSQNFVVAGPSMSLHGLNVKLRQLKAAPGDDQSRIPYSKRKPVFSHSFLPITAPFHSKYLADATVTILDDVKDIQILGRSLRISVYHPSSGEDLSRSAANIIPDLVRAITEDVVNWATATKFTDATHILEFGPGAASGIGMLTNRNKDGRGVRVILADRLEGSSTAVGYRSELFTRMGDEVHYACNWAKTFAPRLLQTPAGTIVDTKLSKVLGLPPLIIAGMTPTTVHWDFVAAAMNAGYHIELATGGYHKAQDLENALLKLEKAIPTGRGITVNVIYASPQAISWQIPLLAKLRSQGVPIDGLTVGAGVPSLEIAQSYIKTIGLRHISFKPGSVAAIEAVIGIAKANPSFPVILQWTGGRAGGHHSFEDFHQPILATYSNIRQCANLILVAGSGFGGSEDTYPYMTGTWSTKFGYPRMPFDGCLFGSRLMVAKEAHTSPDTKLAIVNTPGLADNEWEKTYRPEGAGGLVTVISEMGEPIHMLATRGAKFWSEMDQMIFKLPPALRVEALVKNKKMIVQRLNADFQRVWFGRNAEGRPVELDQMTYGEVLRRLIELLVVRRGGKWELIHESYEKFTHDFVRRIEERFRKSGGPSVLAQMNQGPSNIIQLVHESYPLSSKQLMKAQDVDYFLQLCLRRGRKPLPFIPVLDENFQTYFKKDSLWQSEDLEAVVGQDAGRTCILHGPVAAKYSVTVDESVKDIMDKINRGHINRLILDQHGGSLLTVPGASLSWTRRGNKASTLDALSHFSKWTVSETDEKHIYRVPEKSKLPSTDSWLHLLAGSSRNWREVLFLSDLVMKGPRYQRNPIKDIFAPAPGHIVEISNPNHRSSGCVALKKRCPERGEFVTIASVEFWGSQNRILLCLWSRSSPSSRGVALPLRFSYRPEMGNTPIHENLDNRKQRIRKFYWQTWFGGEEMFDAGADVAQVFSGDEVVVTAESVRGFVQAVGCKSVAAVGRSGKEITAPIDYAIVVAWKAITKPLFCESLDGNLLDLVHLSNEFKVVSGATALKVGDKVLTMSRVTAVVNQDSGRMVEVSGTIVRNNKPLIEIISRFLFRGTFTDFEGTFEMKPEIPKEVVLGSHKDVAILLSKPWVQLDIEDPETQLLGETIEFRLSSANYFKDRNTFDITNTKGEIRLQRPSQSSIPIGVVKYQAGNSAVNTVVEYLQRHGSSIEQPVPLKHPIAIKNDNTSYHTLVAPASNEAYADASGDTNPIHVSQVFAHYVNLPGTITHGMWTSAAVRHLLEVADDHAGRLYSWAVKFVGMVLPNDILQVSFTHTAMIDGRKVIKVEARNSSTDELVLTGEAQVHQPTSAYVFTGQGSQRKGMGMALRESSAVARTVWDRADTYFLATYGFSLSHIVQNDPKELTIHFGGPRGREIRQNYMNLTQESTLSDGSTITTRLLPEITPRSTSYTFRSPIGLLSATQFTQPALTLMEIALFSHLQSQGLIAPNASFAGHSLGEYSALAALGGGVLPVEVPVALTFYRGLAMQLNVSRDENGRSGYSMCAVNPSKILNFSESGLKAVVEQIGETTGMLLEIVNFNVRDLQYICAGEVRALSLLTDFCNAMIVGKRDYRSVGTGDGLAQLIQTLFAAQTSNPNWLQSYARGPATIPLSQIDVPFHSSFMAPSIPSYRSFLHTKILKEKVDPNMLVGKWIPNITGKPFGVGRADWEELERVTGSVRCGEILANWGSYEGRRKKGRRVHWV